MKKVPGAAKVCGGRHVLKAMQSTAIAGLMLSLAGLTHAQQAFGPLSGTGDTRHPQMGWVARVAETPKTKRRAGEAPEEEPPQEEDSQAQD